MKNKPSESHQQAGSYRHTFSVKNPGSVYNANLKTAENNMRQKCNKLPQTPFTKSPLDTQTALTSFEGSPRIPVSYSY